MTHGRNICNQLKEVRKRIAEENGIPLEIEECTYKGECRGTCPRCEAEVRYLENALADRLRLGKVATVAGLALSLAATAQAQAPQNDTELLQDTTKAHKAECRGTLKGMVFDIKTNEPLPFCKVYLLQDGKEVKSGVSDFDGRYTLKPIPFGDYTLRIISSECRQPFERSITINKTGFTVMDVGMTVDSVVIITGDRIPMIEGGVPTSVDEIIKQVGGADGRVNAPKEAIGEIQVKLPGTPANQSTPKEQPTFYEEKEQGVQVKVLSIAALALGLTASTAVQAAPVVLPEVPPVVKEAVHRDDRVKIKGQVIDSKTDEPMPFVNIIITDSNNDTVTVAYTDFDGLYHIEIPKGDYTITFRTVGYFKYVLMEDHYTENRTLPTVKLEASAITMGLMIIDDHNPVIEIGAGADGGMNTEVEGVQVKVR
jgi:hypothetical protein